MKRNSVVTNTCGLSDMLISPVSTVNGEWAPLLYVATECWHREQSNQGQLTFSVPYMSCGVNFRVSCCGFLAIFYRFGNISDVWFKCDSGWSLHSGFEIKRQDDATVLSI